MDREISRLMTMAWLITGALIFSSMFILSERASAAPYTQDDVIYLTGQTYVTVWSVAIGDTDMDGNNEVLGEYAWYIMPYGIPCIAFYQFDGLNYILESKIMNVSMGDPGHIGPGHTIAIADANNDGINEVIFAGRVNGTNGCYAYQWNGVNYSQIANVTGSYIEIAVGDGDSDGNNETYAIAASVIDVFELTGANFVLENSWSLPDTASYVSVADSDDDSNPEIIVATGDLDIAVYQWNGSGYQDDGIGIGPSGFSSHGMGVGDQDGDGIPEVMRVDYWNTITVFGWNGSGYSIEWSGSSNPWGDSVGYGTIGNPDNDGLSEILVGHANFAGGHSLRLFEFNDTVGAYELGWDSGWLDAYVLSIAVGDANNDGLNELITGSGAHSNIRIFSTPFINTPPVAIFSITPAIGALETNYTFDARSSYDNQTPRNDLMIRWDWQNDGLWDTAWSITKTAWHSYPAIGNYTVRLEVKDSFGVTSNTTHTLSVAKDIMPPVTDIHLSGVKGKGWYRTSVSVSFSASDDLSGADWTKYRINGSAWARFSSAFSIIGNGNHTVDYYSCDRANNSETPKSTIVRIDTIEPIIIGTTVRVELSENRSLYDAIISWNASDSLSGIDHYEISVDGGLFVSLGISNKTTLFNLTATVEGNHAFGNHTVIIRAIDKAGNTADITVTPGFDVKGDLNFMGIGLVLPLLIIALVAIGTILFLILSKRNKGEDRPPKEARK